MKFKFGVALVDYKLSYQKEKLVYTVFFPLAPIIQFVSVYVAVRRPVYLDHSCYSCKTNTQEVSHPHE